MTAPAAGRGWAYPHRHPLTGGPRNSRRGRRRLRHQRAVAWKRCRTTGLRLRAGRRAYNALTHTRRAIHAREHPAPAGRPPAFAYPTRRDPAEQERTTRP